MFSGPWEHNHRVLGAQFETRSGCAWFHVPWLYSKGPHNERMAVSSDHYIRRIETLESLKINSNGLTCGPIFIIVMTCIWLVPPTQIALLSYIEYFCILYFVYQSKRCHLGFLGLLPHFFFESCYLYVAHVVATHV